ncbi:MAG: hypothetical protein ACFE0J_21235 [Elainellaceae cyanobacterium]
MEKILRRVIAVERSIQIIAIVALVMFLGYLGIERLNSEPAPAASPTVQQ